MKQSTFEFRDGKIKAVSFDGLTLQQINDGPYVLKIECPDFVPMYFAGSDDNLWEYLKQTGRLIMNMGDLTGYIWLFSCRYPDEFFSDIKDDIKKSTWHDIKLKIESVKSLHPDVVEIQNSSESLPRDEQTPSADPAAKFKSMLA